MNLPNIPSALETRFSREQIDKACSCMTPEQRALIAAAVENARKNKEQAKEQADKIRDLARKQQEEGRAKLKAKPAPAPED